MNRPQYYYGNNRNLDITMHLNTLRCRTRHRHTDGRMDGRTDGRTISRSYSRTAVNSLSETMSNNFNDCFHLFHNDVDLNSMRRMLIDKKKGN